MMTMPLLKVIVHYFYFKASSQILGKNNPAKLHSQEEVCGCIFQRGSAILSYIDYTGVGEDICTF